MATMLCLLSLGLGANAGASPSISGTMTFTGALSATLALQPKLPVLGSPGCQKGPSDNPGDVIEWGNVHVKLHGKAKKLQTLGLSITVFKLGHTYSMKPTAEHTTFGSASLTDGFLGNLWGSTSGQVYVSSSGASGHIDGTFVGSPASLGTLTIKGSWAGCP